ncbi:TIGR03087 family PEP-CTERM/XrtA system glycosyltransferase [Roseomonas terrae]|uniref:TIGR03087 family PEP-CTERM/XrtA system glycosyltransferase n=2 Tax=Neoroseomonas terrae TaxID=424799 RepID=A0ABS5EJB0_9PROT|nr:TIGR03087 family PEP-CTERM/XrtA system glycosyltransferase [Neoroseomonas terrae]
MQRLLFLAHRIPFPPNKGDKIRAWHMLDHLTRSWQVDLGCLVDDPDDLQYLNDLRCRCARVEHAVIAPGSRFARALRGLRPGQPMSLGWFRDASLAAWVRQGLAEGRYDAVVAYSSAMAPYVLGPELRGVRRVLDMVDVDSEKWLAYAADARLPMRHIWAREARTLLAFERRAAAAFDRTLLVSREEAARFVELAPECAARIDWVANGVDLDHFDPSRATPDPYGEEAPAIVFTGTMDYRPNIEAVTWFAEEVLPALRAGQARPPHFHIVGARPADAVRALAALPGVHVAGAVPDTRPYMAHAAVAVAPLRIARGIQNKVLEAMAMARPVVASPEAFEGVQARAGRDLLVADGPAATIAAVQSVLAGGHGGLGAAARMAMAAGHDWRATLRRLDAALARADTGRVPAETVP